MDIEKRKIAAEPSEGHVLVNCWTEPDMFADEYAEPFIAPGNALGTMDEMKAHLKALGLPVSGKKDDLAARIRENDPAAVLLDDGKPWKPAKSALRVLAAIWGGNAAKWIGMSCTLYNDETVTWAGVAVGGIRVSHMEGLTNGSSFIVLPAFCGTHRQ